MGIGNLNMSLKNVLLKNHLWTNPKGVVIYLSFANYLGIYFFLVPLIFRFT